jgi:hypothetical protein
MSSSHNPKRVLCSLGTFLLPVFGCVLAVIIWTGPFSGTAFGLADNGTEVPTESAGKESELEVAAAEKAVADTKAAADRAAADKAAADKATAEAKAADAKAAADKAAAAKGARDQAAREKAEKDQAAKDKAVRGQAAREKAEKEQAAKDKAAKDKAAEAGSETLGRKGREHIAISCVIILLVLMYVTVYAFLKSGIRRSERKQSDTTQNDTPKTRWQRPLAQKFLLHGFMILGLLALVLAAWFLTSPLDAESSWGAPRENWFANITLPELTLLIVATFGSLGGMLFTMLDNKLTLPSYDPEAREIKLGYLVDCAYGWGGAFAVFLVIPGNLTINDNLMKVIGTAIVAGYGGRAVMERSLGKILARVNEVEGTFAKEDAALTKTREKLEGKDVPDDDLAKAIKESSATGRTLIFKEVQDFLEQHGDDPTRVDRTLPILTALTKSDDQQQIQRYFASLGYALLRAKKEPDYEAALHAFQEAIKIRKNVNAAADGTYELGRAVCKIKLEGDKAEIEEDLRVAAAEGDIKERYAKQKAASDAEKKDGNLKIIDSWLSTNNMTAQDVDLE